MYICFATTVEDRYLPPPTENVKGLALSQEKKPQSQLHLLKFLCKSDHFPGDIKENNSGCFY